MKTLLGIEQMRKKPYYKMLRSLYGLKNQNVIAFYKRIGFCLLNVDPSIFIYQMGKKIIAINIYVDNFLLVFNNIPMLKNLKKSLVIEYKMKNLGEVKTIIRWQITSKLSITVIRVSQLAYIRDQLEEANFTNYNALTILIKAGSFNESGDYDKANLRDYQQLIEKLIYFACGTKLNIAFVVRRLSKYNANPRKGHL